MPDELHDRMSRLADDAAHDVEPVDGAAVRQAARRRRTQAAAATAAALVLALAAGTAFGIVAARDQGGTDVAAPAQTPPAPAPTTAAGTPTPTATTATSPPPAPPPPAPPATPSATSAPPAPAGVSTAALLTPADLGASWALTGEAANLRPSDLDPCGGTRYPTDEARIASRTREYAVVDAAGAPVPRGDRVRETVVLYRDAATAAEAMAGYRRVLGACKQATTPGPNGTTVTWTYAVEQDGGLGGEESLLVRRQTGADGAQKGPLQYLVIARDHDAVATTLLHGGAGGATPARARALAPVVASRLCVVGSGSCD